MTDRRARQAWYDRIRESSKDEVILEEMVRLGFWSDTEGKPDLPQDLLKQQGALQRELREILARQRAMEDPVQALKILRKERLIESRRKRDENKRKRVEDRHARSVAWFERQQHEITHLGRGVSSELGNYEGQPDRLSAYKLPLLNNAQALAEATLEA